MRSLRDLLAHHSVPAIKVAEITRACAEVASTLAKVAVSPKQVRYENETLFLSVPSVVKSELLMREEELKRALGELGIRVSAIR